MSGKHVIDPAPEQQAYDVCARCGLAITERADGRGLVTMLTGNPECYGVARDRAGHALSCSRDHALNADCPVITEDRLS